MASVDSTVFPLSDLLYLSLIFGPIRICFYLSFVAGDALGVIERWLFSHLPPSMATREIQHCWSDEVAALAVVLLHIELLPMSWRLAIRNYKLASVNTCHPPKKKRIRQH